jgi:phytol kinase
MTLKLILALAITFIVAVSWLRLNDFAASKDWISSKLSRKIIHIGTGPLFVACWLLFPDHPSARYLAALVPALISIQFILVGSGVIKDQAAVDAMSRTGDRREILQGPLFYGLIFVLITVIYWKTSPVGIIALMLMCGGDGLADILGRKYGIMKIPWNRTKSWVGSLGMFIGGWICAVVIIMLYLYKGQFNNSIVNYFLPLFIIASIGTLVESLPIPHIDNITVTIAALIVGHFIFI